jgi:hypothetical protein
VRQEEGGEKHKRGTSGEEKKEGREEGMEEGREGGAIPYLTANFVPIIFFPFPHPRDEFFPA